jgi:hypothetical protein
MTEPANGGRLVIARRKALAMEGHQMVKLALSYARYALSALSCVGFASMN